MNQEGKFYAVVWTLAAIVFLGFTGSYIICNSKDNDTMLEMVKVGANPLEASCAVLGNHSSSSIDCNILMAKK